MRKGMQGPTRLYWPLSYQAPLQKSIRWIYPTSCCTSLNDVSCPWYFLVVVVIHYNIIFGNDGFSALTYVILFNDGVSDGGYVNNRWKCHFLHIWMWFLLTSSTSPKTSFCRKRQRYCTRYEKVALKSSLCMQESVSIVKNGDGCGWHRALMSETKFTKKAQAHIRWWAHRRICACMIQQRHGRRKTVKREIVKWLLILILYGSSHWYCYVSIYV